MDYSNKTILIVDDENFFNKYISRVLEFNLNVKTISVLTAKEAFEYLRENKPDLIILDMMMPIMDGLTVLKHIRSIDSIKSIPVIVCTAMGSQEVLADVLALNISDFIVKPTKEEILLEKVTKVLDFVK